MCNRSLIRLTSSKISLTLIIVLLSCIKSFSQELKKNDFVEYRVPGQSNNDVREANSSVIELLEKSNDCTTLLLNDVQLKACILNDRARRDFLTSLPGFMFLGVDEKGLRVTIQNDYVKKYLVEHLGFKEADIINL